MGVSNKRICLAKEGNTEINRKPGIGPEEEAVPPQFQSSDAPAAPANALVQAQSNLCSESSSSSGSPRR